VTGRKVSTCTQTQKNAHTHKHQTSMPWLGFEPTIPACERPKTLQALDRSATATGHHYNLRHSNFFIVYNIMLSFMTRRLSDHAELLQIYIYFWN
jgi:hypothetical protein